MNSRYDSIFVHIREKEKISDSYDKRESGFNAYHIRHKSPVIQNVHAK